MENNDSFSQLPTGASLRFSVVIPVYRDWPRLRRCLSALSTQAFPSSGFEVIVVDNDDLPLAAAERPTGIRYVHEPAGFSYAARNAGLRHASGEVIAFTDADCLPEPHWLEAGSKAIQSLDLAGGPVDIFRERETVAARYDCAFGLRQAEFFETWRTFATANLFVRKEVFERIGPFDGALESGGDFEFCRRAEAAGLRLGYAPLARVRHPARSTLSELISQARRTARGLVDAHYRRHYPTRSRAWRAVLRMLRPRPRDWYFALAGGRGSETLPAHQRPAVLGCKVLLHYVFGLTLAAALWQSMRKRDWP